MNGKQNYKENKELRAKLIDTEIKLSHISVELNNTDQAINKAIDQIVETYVTNTLRSMNVDELSKEKSGIRVSALKKAGYNDLYTISQKNLSQLVSIDGIGYQNAEKIIDSVNKIKNSTRSSARLRISPDNKSYEYNNLLHNLYVLKNTDTLKKTCKSLYDSTHLNIKNAIENSRCSTSFIRWLFTSSSKKTQAINDLSYIRDCLSGEYSREVKNIYAQYESVNNSQGYWQDFEENAATYYSILEKHNHYHIDNTDEQTGLTIEETGSIENTVIDLTGLICTLRSYQKFAVKYILCKKKVLLGDEMGLGKTVEAIAAMVSLRNSGESHFMVVCPASVLENWMREIAKHSNLTAMLAHGWNALNVFDSWAKNGGVIVSNYETVGKFIDYPDNYRMGLMVVDEAHYVKNPGAQRTKDIISIENNAENVLFMTGTALENKVSEMQFLISCLQPAVANEIKNKSQLSSASSFRRIVAPVYLRRTREEVLKELPDMIQTDEWCEMGNNENQIYKRDTMNRKFMDMRQVSWNVDNIEDSSKAKRLLDICSMARESSRKVIVFSYFINTLNQVKRLIGDQCAGPIYGAVAPNRRQEIIDEFSRHESGKSVLVAQVQSGGTGLNIQAASVVVICEPQIKPSLETQAISRSYRMGQIRSVLVYRLCCKDSVDERIMEMLENKQKIFDEFADKSVSGERSIEIAEKDFGAIIDEENKKFEEQPA